MNNLRYRIKYIVSKIIKETLFNKFNRIIRIIFIFYISIYLYIEITNKSKQKN